MALEFAFLAAFLVIGVGGALLLYVLVERESDSTETMRRSDAENEVRRDR